MRALLASLTLLLAACGFQPMYAQPGGGAAIGPVEVEQIDSMAGHVLKAELDRILAVENNGEAPALLRITLSEQVTPLGIRVDESATRSELRLIANYVLTPPGPGARAMRGSVFTVVNYDIPTAAFGEITAALSTDDWAAIESAAGRLGSSPQTSMMCQHMGAGAPGFTERGLAFHTTSDGIGEAARAKDRGGVVKATATTVASCTACHARFRQDIVSDAAYAAATGSAQPKNTPAPGGPTGPPGSRRNPARRWRHASPAREGSRSSRMRPAPSSSREVPDRERKRGQIYFR